MTTFTPPSFASTLAFLGIVSGVLAAIVIGVSAASRRLGGPPSRRVGATALALGAWLAGTSAIVASGALAAAPMPRIPLFFAAINLAAVAAALSPVGRWLATGLPLPALVAFQGFRLPLELVLHTWAAQGTIPETMTWTGSNYDILSGLTAIALAPWASRSRTLAWAANIIGLTLLVNVGRVALLSSPLPFAWPDIAPPLELVLYLPYAWIGPVCVAGALAGHVVLTRALLLRGRGSGRVAARPVSSRFSSASNADG